MVRSQFAAVWGSDYGKVTVHCCMGIRKWYGHSSLLYGDQTMVRSQFTAVWGSDHGKVTAHCL